MMTLNQVAELLPKLLKNNIVPYLKGSPAIGKSAAIHAIAKKYDLKVIDIRLAQCDPTDLAGFPVFNHQTERASYYPLSTFPTEDTPIPQGYNGWLIFLDEFSSASVAVQSAAYKLVLDRMVGQHHLHPKAFLVAAGNREDDNAIVVPMSTALVSRFAIFDVNLSTDEWLEWASQANVDSRITSFLHFRPSNLYTFKPETAEKPYGSPRTWEMVNRVINKEANIPDEYLNIFQALLGEGVGTEFDQFLKLQQEIPTMQEIISNPTGLPVSDKLGTCWAIMGMIIEHINTANFKPVSKYLDRFPAELRVVAMKEIQNRHPALKAVPGYGEWIVKTASEVL